MLLTEIFTNKHREPLYEQYKKVLLLERLVKSSWLKDITYHGRQNPLFPGEEFITFQTKFSPKTYIIRGVGKNYFIRWMRTPSKGRFWHANKFKINRDWFLSNPFSIVSMDKIQNKVQ